MAKIVLQLHIRPAAGQREALLSFLREARVYYESPDGIRMRVLESREDADAIIEVFEYETERAFEADEWRVEHDEQMKALLAKWRSLLAGPPRVEVFREVAV